MPRKISYQQFKPRYSGSVSKALANTIESILNRRTSRYPNYKGFLAIYLAAGSIKRAERGIKFDINENMILSIDGTRFPVFDAYEVILYRSLFNGYMDAEYILHGNKDYVINLLRPMERYVKRYITFNTPFSLTSLRQLRFYALIHDYHVSKEAIREIFKYKTYPFGHITLDSAIEQLGEGIKISANI